MRVFINKDECIGCKKCIAHCPFNAIEFAETKAYINDEKCTTCGACIETCPVEAIHSEGKKKQIEKDFSDYRDIWVV
ncbi:MAG: DUF362 domain-containing protein, partial [Candidatus Muiribacteriaceae bacterium]